jgi:hypothetical protein
MSHAEALRTVSPLPSHARLLYTPLLSFLYRSSSLQFLRKDVDFYQFSLFSLAGEELQDPKGSQIRGRAIDAANHNCPHRVTKATQTNQRQKHNWTVLTAHRREYSKRVIKGERRPEGGFRERAFVFLKIFFLTL